jgi:hypothetical protein
MRCGRHRTQHHRAPDPSIHRHRQQIVGLVLLHLSPLSRILQTAPRGRPGPAPKKISRVRRRQLHTRPRAKIRGAGLALRVVNPHTIFHQVRAPVKGRPGQKRSNTRLASQVPLTRPQVTDDECPPNVLVNASSVLLFKIIIYLIGRLQVQFKSETRCAAYVTCPSEKGASGPTRRTSYEAGQNIRLTDIGPPAPPIFHQGEGEIEAWLWTRVIKGWITEFSPASAPARILIKSIDNDNIGIALAVPPDFSAGVFVELNPREYDKPSKRDPSKLLLKGTKTRRYLSLTRRVRVLTAGVPGTLTAAPSSPRSRPDRTHCPSCLSPSSPGRTFVAAPPQRAPSPASHSAPSSPSTSSSGTRPSASSETGTLASSFQTQTPFAHTSKNAYNSADATNSGNTRQTPSPPS